MKGIMPEKKWVTYSAHDSNVAPLLLSLAPTYNYTWIPYASVITIEVFQVGESPVPLYVRLMYNG